MGELTEMEPEGGDLELQWNLKSQSYVYSAEILAMSKESEKFKVLLFQNLSSDIRYF